jgi:hypothetical protein
MQSSSPKPPTKEDIEAVFVIPGIRRRYYTNVS